MQQRAKKLCPSFAVDSFSGEELYWLAKLCNNGADFSKAQLAVERYLAFQGGQHQPDARLELAELQMRLTGEWQKSWETYRTVLQIDSMEEAEVRVRIAIEEEAEKNEATALEWEQERYWLLQQRAANPQAGVPPISYVWVFMAGGDLVHRYYLAGDTGKAKDLLLELNHLKDQHPNDVWGWAADCLNAANMEMNPAPRIPVLKALGKSPAAELIQNGRVEVVHFMFLRCSPCITDLEYLDDFQSRYKKGNVLVANVTTYKAALQPDEPSVAMVNSALDKFHQKKSPRLTTVVAPEQTLADYKITAYPVIAVIDKAGRLRYEGMTRGFDEGEDIDRLVRKLLAE